MKSVKFFDQQPVKKIKLENNFDLFKLTPNQIKNTKIYNYIIMKVKFMMNYIKKH